MKRSVNNLIGYSIKAKDGEIGKVSEFFFDDHSWKIRYLVVETGGWLDERRVLIPHAALGITDWGAETFQVDLTVKQVKDSPDIDAHKPVSRQHELDLFQYYTLPIYWDDVFYSGPLGTTPSNSITDNGASLLKADLGSKPHNDPRLRSSNSVKGYHIHASDGEIGHLSDFIVEDEEWVISYIVVDTTNWLPGTKVLIKPIWIHRIDWSESLVYVNLTMDLIKSSPKFDPSEPIGQNYEGDLFNHYGEQISHY